MTSQDTCQEFHQQAQITHDAIKDVAHGLACRCHAAKHDGRLEAALYRVSQEMTELAARVKEDIQ
jgi:hypothetical protein